MSAAVQSPYTFQNDATKHIYHTVPSPDPEYWPESGPVVVPELHTPRVSAYELDALELASHDKIVFTTNSDVKALEVGALAIADPLGAKDTTLVDSGDKQLLIRSAAQTSLDSDIVDVNAVDSYYNLVTGDTSGSAGDTVQSHHYATADKMILGTGVLADDKSIVSGGFLETNATTFALRHDRSKIGSDTADESRLKYMAGSSHEFFVGSDALAQPNGSGAIEIREDLITIRKNVRLMGNIDSVETQSEDLQVEDQIIQLAHTDDPATANRDDLLVAAGKAGLSIQTVPADYDQDSEYMSTFTDGAGEPIFVDDVQAAIDVEKAKNSDLFTKEIAYYINQGSKSAGQRTTASRLNEPYWQVQGGSLQIAHAVPRPDGQVRKYVLGFRITDDGSMEMVRITRHLVWSPDDGIYVPDTSKQESVSVISRYVNPA